MSHDYQSERLIQIQNAIYKDRCHLYRSLTYFFFRPFCKDISLSSYDSMYLMKIQDQSPCLPHISTEFFHDTLFGIVLHHTSYNHTSTPKTHNFIYIQGYFNLFTFLRKVQKKVKLGNSPNTCYKLQLIFTSHFPETLMCHNNQISCLPSSFYANVITQFSITLHCFLHPFPDSCIMSILQEITCFILQC